MRILVTILILAAALWSGAWMLARAGLERGIEAWLADRAGEGWQAEAEVAASGFPTAFALTLTDIALADPGTGLAWRAPRFMLAADVWAPTAITATWPPEHIVASPLERITVASEAMEAALNVVPSRDLTLISASVDLREMVLTSTGGWDAALAEGTLDLARLDADPLTQDIRFVARELRPGRAALDRLDPAGLLPGTVAEARVAALVTFDAPWDRRAIEDRRPQITALDLGQLRAEWGRMVLEAAGTLAVDAEGIPEGRITVRAVNWRDMVAVGRNSGAIPGDFVPIVTRALELLAGLGGNPGTIDAPLTFAGGRVSFGPLPLGPAPRLKLR